MIIPLMLFLISTKYSSILNMEQFYQLSDLFTILKQSHNAFQYKYENHKPASDFTINIEIAGTRRVITRLICFYCD